MNDVKRSVKVAARLREELAQALAQLTDPRIVGTIVSRVEMTDDLQIAKIYVRHELGASEPADQKRLLSALESASGRLRREVTRALALRFSPSLRFYYDTAPETTGRIEEILREIAEESKPS